MDVHAEPMPALRTRTSEKWTAYPPDVLPLFVAEMDYPLAEPVARVLHEAVERGDTGYAGQASGIGDAFAGFARRHWGWQVDPAHVSTTTDVSVVIVESLRLAIAPGDGVIITPPVYPPFFDLPREAGGSVVEVPLLTGTDAGRLDLAGIGRALAAGARAILLCNPHNPLGLVHPREDLAELAEMAARHDAVVVSDEIHAALTHRDAVFTPYLSVSDAARQTGIAAHSASKAWNLAGLKCALFVTASERMGRLLGGLPEEVHFRTSLFGRMANEAAFRDGDAWLAAVLEAIEANRALLGSLLAERIPDAVYREPRASYLAWVDLSALGWGDDPAAVALERARVAFANGPRFGREGRGFVRINLGCAPDTLAEAIARVAEARQLG